MALGIKQTVQSMMDQRKMCVDMLGVEQFIQKTKYGKYEREILDKQI